MALKKRRNVFLVAAFCGFNEPVEIIHEAPRPRVSTPLQDNRRQAG
jgi:hypothetical protein